MFDPAFNINNCYGSQSIRNSRIQNLQSSSLNLSKYTLTLDHTSSTGLKTEKYTDKNTTTTPSYKMDLKHPSPYAQTNYPTPKHHPTSSQAPKHTQHKNQTPHHPKHP
jgi:hypothetical protein